MMKGAAVTLVGLLVTTVIILTTTTFKFAHGIQCYSCGYFKIGNQEFGDLNCKYGGKSLPTEECSENSIIPTTAIIPGSPKVRIGDVRKMLGENNPLFAENNTYYGCDRSEAVASATNGQSFSMMSRFCTFSPVKMTGCKSGSSEQDLGILRNMIPAEAQLHDFQVCVCFKDKCNEGGNKLGGLLAWETLVFWTSVLMHTVAQSHSLF